MQILSTAYYTSFEKKDAPTGHAGRKNHACKHKEFFLTWYKMTRKFYPNHTLYVLDNGSPISSEWLHTAICEPIQEILANQYTLDGDDSRFFLKKFEKRCGHKEGWARAFVETFLMSWHNQSDFFWIESDSLLACDILPRLKDFDTLCPYFLSDYYGQRVMYMKYEQYKNFLIDGRDFKSHLLYILSELDNGNIERGWAKTAEGYFVKDFAHKTKRYGWPKDSPYVHDCGEQELEDFLRHNRMDGGKIENKKTLDIL